MMRGIDRAAMAVRTPEGGIDVETWPIQEGKNRPWYKKVPFVRGVVNMVISLVDGYKCLMKSAEKSGMADEEEEEPQSKFDQWLTRVLGDKMFAVIGTIAMVIAIPLAILLFMFVPMFLVKGLDSLVELGYWKVVIEGILKIAIFVGYLALVSRMKDIQRVFMYHGAEHKSIFCYEAGEELTVENIRKQSRFHPRCGTSFLLIVVVISILVFSLVTWDIAWRMVLKILLLPVIVGVSYEIIKLAGRYDNLVTRIVSAPGLWLQRLTTREPDDSQIEVAIEALKPVIPADRSEDRW